MNIKQLLFWGSLLLSSQIISAQQKDTLYSFTIGTDVMVSIDQPLKIKKCKTILVFYALPNGNTTAQSMGKLMKAGEDWHFDIQHVRAQTAFIRQQLKNKNIIVAYLENNFKSWPAWKQKHRGFATEIKKIIDTVASLFKKPLIYLNGHSGGGSFILGI